MSKQKIIEIMTIIEEIIEKTINKLLKKDVRIHDSNILIELRKVTNDEIKEIIKAKRL